MAAPDGTVALPVVQRDKPIQALLCEVLVHTKELLARLEAKGVYVPRDDQKQVVRELYVQTRRQLQALAACPELEGLE